MYIYLFIYLLLLILNHKRLKLNHGELSDLMNVVVHHIMLILMVMK